LTLLSDGAFKIYVYVCLHAGRRTAQLRFRIAELAKATGHSTRSLTSYLEELHIREVSIVYRAANQHELGRIEICGRMPNKRCMSRAFAVYFWSLLRRHRSRDRYIGDVAGLLAISCGEDAEDGKPVACASKFRPGNTHGPNTETN
jgi:hypothetical protein